MNEEARKKANLRVLQRNDPTITDIIGTATHVVLYTFQDSSQSWEKNNVEGSLFLAVRQHGYMLFILNRSSPENYLLALTKDFQLQNNDPYLIFRQVEDGKEVVRGIWFPNSQERTTMNQMLNQVLAKWKVESQTPPRPAAAAPKPAVDVDQTAVLKSILSPMTKLTIDSSPSPAPAPATASPRHTSPSGSTHPPTLDKKSLQLALLSLIQDDRFLDLLHAQYLKVAQARANRK